MKTGILTEKHRQEELGDTDREIERAMEDDIWPRINSLMEELGFNELDVELEADMNVYSDDEKVAHASGRDKGGKHQKINYRKI